MKKNRTNTKIKLTPKYIGGKIQDVRKTVTDQMKRRGMTPYSVAKQAVAAGGKLSEQTVRNFVSGKTPMTSDKLAAVFAVLGLEVRARR